MQIFICVWYLEMYVFLYVHIFLFSTLRLHIWAFARTCTHAALFPFSQRAAVLLPRAYLINYFESSNCIKSLNEVKPTATTTLLGTIEVL